MNVGLFGKQLVDFPCVYSRAYGTLGTLKVKTLVEFVRAPNGREVWFESIGSADRYGTGFANIRDHLLGIHRKAFHVNVIEHDTVTTNRYIFQIL